MQKDVLHLIKRANALAVNNVAVVPVTMGSGGGK